MPAPVICARCGAPVQPLTEIQTKLSDADGYAERLARLDKPDNMYAHQLGTLEAVASLAARALACHTKTCQRPSGGHHARP